MDLIKKNIVIVSVWIFFWSFIAIDQLLITFNYLNTSNEISTQESIENINNINKNFLVNTLHKLLNEQNQKIQNIIIVKMKMFGMKLTSKLLLIKTVCK